MASVQNRDLFGEDEIRSMKDGSCLINLSRGFVVDHDSLARNLKSGKLAGSRCGRRVSAGNRRVVSFSIVRCAGCLM